MVLDINKEVLEKKIDEIVQKTNSFLPKHIDLKSEILKAFQTVVFSGNFQGKLDLGKIMFVSSAGPGRWVILGNDELNLRVISATVKFVPDRETIIDIEYYPYEIPEFLEKRIEKQVLQTKLELYGDGYNDSGS